MMHHLDLFAGIGGFSLAARWMGWETVGFVEKEPFCQKVLRKNFGLGIDIHDDIFHFSGEPFRGRVDIVTGGFPCQPFSAAGKRNGRRDERHLFPEMLRVVREVQPRWVIAENVRGLLSIEDGSAFAEVVASLEGEGFEVVTFCIPASAVEAPHRRDRLWIVGDRRRREELSASDGMFGEPRCNRRANGETQGTLWRDEAGDVSAGLVQHAPHAESNRTRRESRTLRRTECRSNNGMFSGISDPDCDPWRESWINVAARTCVRGMDDGVSDRVHRLKALGNSIVPQISYEIFKAIEETENDHPQY